jgi:signal peptidase II
MISLKQRLVTLVSIGIVVVFLDQITKYLVFHYLYQRLIIIPGFFDLVSVYNRGMVFGMFNSGQCIFRTTLLTILSIAVFFILIGIYLFSKDITKLSMLALSLIISGAIGNIIDRIRLGYVIDFIDLYVKNVHWPAFNIADSAITIGAILLAIDLLFGTKKEKISTPL